MDRNILIFGGSIALIGLVLFCWQLCTRSRINADWSHSKRRHYRRIIIGFVFFLVGALLICNAFYLFDFHGHPNWMVAYVTGLIMLALYAVFLAIADAFETLRALSSELTRLIGPLEVNSDNAPLSDNGSPNNADNEIIQQVKSDK
ncbi:MAG: hypothetical protein PHX74_07135 [Candidatus Sumerlaeales bacterium]|nr:hypothetical protein [Candidatus Sumerlaeales bacterium]